MAQQQTQRWLRAESFEAMAHDLRAILRLVQDRNPDPTAVIMDSRTVQSTPESGARAGFDGHKKRKGSKVHAAVDTLGHLLALKVTAANEQDRAQVAELAKAAQAVTGEKVELACVDQGYTGEQPAADESAAIYRRGWRLPPTSICWQNQPGDLQAGGRHAYVNFQSARQRRSSFGLRCPWRRPHGIQAQLGLIVLSAGGGGLARKRKRKRLPGFGEDEHHLDIGIEFFILAVMSGALEGFKFHRLVN